MMFRFDAATHTYYDGDVVRPHITGMLLKAGIMDDRWFTEEGRDRGTAVHGLTAAYDLGAITQPTASTSRYKGYLLAHVAALGMLRPEILEVERAFLSSQYRYGGRPDRLVRLAGLAAVLEIKTGDDEPEHGIQTALQAILVAPRFHLPPEAVKRFALYLRANGKFKVREHPDRRDYDTARRVIRECCV